MAQQLEIEFKNLLTKQQYEKLLQTFQIPKDAIQTQTNHYFDTPTNALKNLMSGLRIRQIGSYYECTLKEKSDAHTHLETTDSLTAEQAEQMLRGKGFFAPEVEKRLSFHNIPINKLTLFGSLTTDRVEIPYKDGLLVFDHSYYLQCDDYEVEYETNDVKKGNEVFNEFLRQHNIEKQKTDKKIARFMKALHAKKG